LSLTSSQWARVTTLFNLAINRPAVKRKCWLARFCADDDQVRSEVEALLVASDENPDFLSTSVKIESARPIAPLAPDLAGTSLGPWRIIEAIGHGGMSDVWRAERSDGLYEQQVAIKVLKRGMDTDALVERFHRERRILARMAHPNIARLIDAGAAPDGRPYLVMEYIAGRTVTEWYESRDLGLRARIELFKQICEAVHAAHHMQVVHRDLKPSNIMVTDGGEIKLLDFGIAKLIESGSDPTQTLLGPAPGTPEYAAPEQLLGKSATPATDVYSLGVLLYRLLTGATPRRYGTLALALVAATRDEGDAERPSVVLRKDNTSTCTTVRGDLDSITLKALQHAPKRRYQNAGELADDVRRYLDRRTVLARRNCIFYRLSRFVQRHRISVAAGSVAAALALVAALCICLREC
jgi:serine/threonine-protein kinase